MVLTGEFVGLVPGIEHLIQNLYSVNSDMSFKSCAFAPWQK